MKEFTYNIGGKVLKILSPDYVSPEEAAKLCDAYMDAVCKQPPMTPEKEGKYYRVSIDDTKNTSLYIPREQHTSFKTALELLMTEALGETATKITIEIW